MTLLLIFISFLLGIAFKKSFITIGVVVISLLIKCLFNHRRRLSLVILGTFLLGFGISFLKTPFQTTSPYTGIVYEVKENYFLITSRGEKFYCYEKETSREVGDILVIEGNKSKLDFVTLESEFNFTNYINYKGVYYELESIKVNVKFSNPIRLKSFRRWFLLKFDENTRISVNSILFSDHDDNELIYATSSLHLNRLINAGGLYFNALMGALIYLFEKRLNTKWSKLSALAISSFYLILTFPRFSIIRLTVFFIGKWINEYLLKKRFSYLELISIIGIGFLLFDYHLAYQDSFILGFAIPIYLFLINNSFSYVKKWKKKVLCILLIYLLFIPFEIRYYNGVNPLLTIYQTILSPLFILFFFISILCLYGLPIYGVANFYNGLLTKIINPFTKVSLEIYVPNMNEGILLLYYVLLLAFIYYFSIGLEPFKRIFLGAYISLLCIYFMPIKNTISSEVCFVNVGQGDCCFIRHKQTTIFIDTGGLKYKDLAKNSLVPFLKKKRVYNIDLVITTHDDYDHNGALSSLRENFKVKEIMTNLTFHPVSYGNLKFVNYNNHINRGGEDNDMSLVIGFSLGGKDYLITGDASKAVEANMMKEYQRIPCDVLKVGHHGSKTSTSDAFIKWLKPQVGIISCGKNNKYGHPNSEVLTILKNNHVQIRRTDLKGTIQYVSYF